MKLWYCNEKKNKLSAILDAYSAKIHWIMFYDCSSKDQKRDIEVKKKQVT
jgi:hypothetical protein